MNKLSKIIRREIAVQGAITFARFMELALYCPDTGYYEKDEDTIGRKGDYFTSVSVGPVFGHLLAFQIAEWMEPLLRGQPAAGPTTGAVIEAREQVYLANKFLIIEAGAHQGQLAKDILDWLGRWRPELTERFTYWIVEPSQRRRQWQKETLRPFGARVKWADSLRAMDQNVRCQTGVILANELLDAMAVHRFGWDAQRQKWFEWGVLWTGQQFGWTRLLDTRMAAGFAPGVSPELLAVLPDDFTTEFCPQAEAWWGEAAGLLQQGKILTFDYGLEAEDFFAAHRLQGTLRACRSHQPGQDVLACPGEQDITAHINFSSLRRVGEAAGLQTESLMLQGQFLTHVAERFWQMPVRNGAWTPKQRREFQTLIHPQHLGTAFRVLVQGHRPSRA